jgi:hypothetical protein
MDTNHTPARRRRPSASLIVSVVALCFALMGTAVAAGLAPNSVGSKQIKDNGVKVKDLRDGSVTSAKIADFDVANEDLRPGLVTTDKIATDDVQSQDVAADAIGNSELALTVRTASVNVANNATGSLTRPCAAGETVIAGGGGFPGVPNGTTLATSQAAGGGWHVEGKNASGSVQTLIVQAFCLRQ